MTNLSASIAGWLITYAVHSTLLLGGGWLLQRAYVRSAAGRDLLWKLAAFVPLVSATVSVVLPRQAVPLASRYEWSAPVAVAPEPSLDLRDLAATPADAIMPGSIVTPSAPVKRIHLPAWPLLITSVWALGALLACGLLVRRHLRARRRLRTRAAASAAEVLAELRVVVERSGLRRPIRLTMSETILSPIALGRAEICLPSCVVARLSPLQRQAMFAHELAHLERNDPYWLLAFSCLESMLFFQPLNRNARQGFQLAAEQLCDEWALVHTRQPLALAQCLAEVAHWLRGERTPLPYPGMAEANSPLLDRVQRVLGGTREPLRLSVRARLAAAACVIVFAATAPAVTGAAATTTPRASGQGVDIARAVEQTGTGILRFAFNTRAGVCGTGEERDGTRMFALRPDRDWQPAGSPDRQVIYNWDRGKLMRHVVGTDGQWTIPCNRGPARVDLTVAGGIIQRIDLSVADPAPRVTVARDLGLLEAEARDFLKALANTAGEVGQRARIALLLTTGPAAAALPPSDRQDDLERVADLTLPWDQRLAALSRATARGLSAERLIAAYPRVPDRAMRVELIGWLSSRGNARVDDFLRDVVRQADVWEEQQAALAVLFNSGNAGNRAFASEYMKKREPTTAAGLQGLQGGLASRIANAPNGVVHFTYAARPEACGSGIDRDGAGMFALLPSERIRPVANSGHAAFYSFDADDFTRLGLEPNSSWTPRCENGPVHLFIDQRDHTLLSLRIAVGSSLANTRVDTELGAVGAPEAAAFLLQLARRAGRSIAANAVLAAFMAADQPALYDQLITIAADPSLSAHVRQTALHWVAVDQSPGAREAIRRNAPNLPRASDVRDDPYSPSSIGEQSTRLGDDSDITVQAVLRVALDPRQPVETRQKSIKWAEGRNLSVTTLASLYDHMDSRAMQEFMIDFLKGIDQEPSSRKLIQIVQNDPSAALRGMARTALRAHQNPVARSIR